MPGKYDESKEEKIHSSSKENLERYFENFSFLTKDPNALSNAAKLLKQASPAMQKK